MAFHSQLISRLISLIAIGVYLAAAFLPCEPTPQERSALATALRGGTAHAAAPMPVSMPAPVAAPTKAPAPAPQSTPASDDHAHHHVGAKAVPVAHDHAAHGHASVPAAAPVSVSARAHGDHAHGDAPASDGFVSEAAETKLELKAKCICGCDRTRSQIGGGAARLGAAVLIADLDGLPTAPVVVPEDRVLSRWVEVHFGDDPVPI